MPSYNYKKAFTGPRNKKRVAAVKKVAKKAYGGYKKVMKYSTAINAAATLAKAGMHLMNIEKKRVDVADGVGVPLGLQATAADGAFKVDLSPAIPQGVTGNTRNGNSIKFVSACLDFQVSQQVNAINQFRYKWYLVNRPDASIAQSATDCHLKMFEPNLFTGFRDYHANRDPEFFHQVRIIKSGRGYLSQDSLTAGVGINQHKVPLKLSLHQKYATDAALSTTKNQIYLIIVADSGDTNASTGCVVKYNMRFYYVDN